MSTIRFKLKDSRGKGTRIFHWLENNSLISCITEGCTFADHGLKHRLGILARENRGKGTHTALISPSLELLETRCLALHIRTKAQAPTASHIVHNIEEVPRDVGSNVEKSDKNRGD